MKTMNAATAGFVPLNEKETQSIRGGFGILAAIAIGLAIAAGAEIFGDWDNFKRGLAGLPEVK